MWPKQASERRGWSTAGGRHASGAFYPRPCPARLNPVAVSGQVIRVAAMSLPAQDRSAEASLMIGRG